MELVVILNVVLRVAAGMSLIEAAARIHPLFGRVTAITIGIAALFSTCVFTYDASVWAVKCVRGGGDDADDSAADEEPVEPAPSPSVLPPAVDSLLAPDPPPARRIVRIRRVHCH